MDQPRNFALSSLPRLMHRVGWASNPIALRPWSTIDREDLQGRFDDPNREYRTFYAAATPEAALREKIFDMLRRDNAALARIDAVATNDEDRALAASLRSVPQSLLTDFVLTTVEVVTPAEVVNVTASASFDAYVDLTDMRLCVDDILDSACTATSRAFGAKVWQRGYPGVVYPSRHGTDLTNFALFETGKLTDELAVAIRQIDLQPLDDACEPLKAVAAALGLTLDFPPTYDTRALWVRAFRDLLSRLGTVNWYERPIERGVRYYSMRFGGAKISIVTFAATNTVEVDAMTPEGGGHVSVTTSTNPEDVLLELSAQDPSVRAALEPLLG